MKNKQKGAIINSLGNLKSKVVTANCVLSKTFKPEDWIIKDEPDKIPVPEKKNTPKIEYEEVEFMITPDWYKKLEDYCGQQGILPEDLIAFHAEGCKPAKMGRKKGIVSEIKETNTKSNWRKEYIEKKTGIKSQ